jgi:hypothetical protein
VVSQKHQRGSAPLRAMENETVDILDPIEVFASDERAPEGC